MKEVRGGTYDANDCMLVQPVGRKGREEGRKEGSEEGKKIGRQVGREVGR